MRERLFRGKSYTDSKWHYGYFFYRFSTPFSPERYEITDGAGNGWNCPEEAIGQFTGITDKNGKKIFEGDIIQGIHKEQYAISYNADIASFVAHSADGNPAKMLPCMNVGTMQSYEVVGNIYDNNHELMEPTP